MRRRIRRCGLEPSQGARESAIGEAALEPPDHDRPLNRLAGLGVTPEFARLGARERQPVGAHMVLAGDIDRGRPLAREIIEAELPGQGLIARGWVRHLPIFELYILSRLCHKSLISSQKTSAPMLSEA